MSLTMAGSRVISLILTVQILQRLGEFTELLQGHTESDCCRQADLSSKAHAHAHMICTIWPGGHCIPFQAFCKQCFVPYNYLQDQPFWEASIISILQMRKLKCQWFTFSNRLQTLQSTAVVRDMQHKVEIQRNVRISNKF